MIQRIKTVIFVFVLCVGYITSIVPEAAAQQDKPITVTIKYDRIFTFTSIEKIEHWGIVALDDDSLKTILYKVIEKIELPDSSLIDEIEYHVPGIQVTKANCSYILDFKHAKIPVLEYRETRIIHYKHIPLALRMDPVETFEVGLVYSLWPLHEFRHNFSFSTGFPYGSDPSYHIMALNYGIGTSIYRTEIFEFTYHINYHMKVLERTFDAGSEFEKMGILSVEPTVFFFPSNRASPSVSLRYYFDNFEIDKREMRLILIATLNIAIGKKD
jgi:hypothetical protein